MIYLEDLSEQDIPSAAVANSNVSGTLRNYKQFELPEPLPLPTVPAGKALPSSAINKGALSNVEAVLKSNFKLSGEAKAGTSTHVLDREAIFGEDVMKQCTPFGNSHLSCTSNQWRPG